MAIGTPDPVLMQAAVFLSAAVIGVPIARFLGLGSILGYMAAGTVIGQVAIALGYWEELQDAGEVVHFAEFGVVLLLFVIGLELRPARLWRLRIEVFGLGLAQVIVTGAAIGAVLYAAGFSWQGAVTVGSGLALSSTAFAVQILRERGELTQPHGDRAFSILLFQDLAIVPLFALAALLGPGPEDASGPDPTEQALWGVGAVVGLLIVGRYALRPIFRIIALTRADEIFTAAALLVVVGAALLMQAAGLSMALGAFIAGVLLAETEYRHQVETDIEPFRGIFLGLFFMGIGMSIRWPVVLDNLAVVLASALGLYLLKGLILYALTRLRGSPHRDALRISALLGQGGEFGFVIFGIAAASFLIDRTEATLLAAIIAISMALTPFAALLAAKLGRQEESADGLEGIEAAPADKAQMIVAGFGRIGQVVAQIMRMRGHEVTLIDTSPKQIRLAETFGTKVFFGDATRIDVMRMAGAADAKAIFLCIDDREGAQLAAEKLRASFPATPIFATTYDRFSALALERAGAKGVVRETFESAVEVASLALREIGDGAAVDETVEEFRRRDAELLRLQIEFGAREGLKKLREGYSLDKSG